MKRLNLPRQVKIVEVGPRDGLQNEKIPIPVEEKLQFIQGLANAGLRHIEATSFVNPKAIPQLADAAELYPQLPQMPGVEYSVLVPNLKGLDRAIAAGVRRIAVFTAASNTFVQRNINMSIGESLRVFGEVAEKAIANGMTVRGYVSTAFVCPYERDIPADMTRDVTQALLEIGCDEVSIGDTIGAASPRDVYETMDVLLEAIPADRLALHFHNTYGTAMANILAGLELGITTFDTSAGGLGGCPYAPGASGNVSTEDVVYMMTRMGIDTGVQIEKVAKAASRIERLLGRELPSQQLRRLTNETYEVESLRAALDP